MSRAILTGGIKMKYCSKCKSIQYKNNPEKCPVCGRGLIENPSTDSQVGAVTANGFELERIRAALSDGDVPFSVHQIRKDTGLQILNSAPPENCTVYVPLSAYPKAQEILVGIGAVPLEEALSDDDEQAFHNTDTDTEEEMSPRKQRTVRILSALAFLALLAAIAYLTDFLMSFVTPFLRH